MEEDQKRQAVGGRKSSRRSRQRRRWPPPPLSILLLLVLKIQESDKERKRNKKRRLKIKKKKRRRWRRRKRRRYSPTKRSGAFCFVIPTTEDILRTYSQTPAVKFDNCDVRTLRVAHAINTPRMAYIYHYYYSLRGACVHTAYALYTVSGVSGQKIPCDSMKISGKYSSI